MFFLFVLNNLFVALILKIWLLFQFVSWKLKFPSAFAEYVNKNKEDQATSNNRPNKNDWVRILLDTHSIRSHISLIPIFLWARQANIYLLTPLTSFNVAFNASVVESRKLPSANTRWIDRFFFVPFVQVALSTLSLRFACPASTWWVTGFALSWRDEVKFLAYTWAIYWKWTPIVIFIAWKANLFVLTCETPS